MDEENTQAPDQEAPAAPVVAQDAVEVEAPTQGLTKEQALRKYMSVAGHQRTSYELAMIKAGFNAGWDANI